MTLLEVAFKREWIINRRGSSRIVKILTKEPITRLKRNGQPRKEKPRPGYICGAGLQTATMLVLQHNLYIARDDPERLRAIIANVIEEKAGIFLRAVTSQSHAETQIEKQNS